LNVVELMSCDYKGPAGRLRQVRGDKPPRFAGRYRSAERLRKCAAGYTQIASPGKAPGKGKNMDGKKMKTRMGADE
jgi:hypothetical protein